MSHTPYRWGWAIATIALVLASLACSALSNAIKNNPAVATAQSVATQAGQLGDLAKTAEAFATEAETSGLAATAEAMATQVGSSGLEATAAALATQAGGGGDIQATAEALATQAVAGLGDVPPDIPIVQGDKTNFFGSKDVVSYATPLTFQEVVDFYKSEMEKNQWSQLKDVSVETADVAVLQYEKTDRSAIVSISADPTSKQTLVQILIQSK